MEEKHSANETMRRENRRVAAMSWSGASGEQDVAPPKPARPNLISIKIRFYFTYFLLYFFASSIKIK